MDDTIGVDFDQQEELTTFIQDPPVFTFPNTLNTAAVQKGSVIFIYAKY